MDYEIVKEKISELNEKFVKVWEDVCNIESPTNYKEGVDKVANFFADMASKRGWKVEWSKQDTAGDVVCITLNPDSANKPIVISGHIDTVHPVGMFGHPAVTKDEEKIYGPGVTDCKGGVVAGFFAMEALCECGYTKRPIKLILQTDEETGSKTSGGETIRYICEMAKDAVVFLNMETHTKGNIPISRKGIISYRFDVVGKEGHSSRCVTEGANAVVDAAYKIIELDRLKNDDGITCNCAIVSGGTVVNTVPGKCSFSVNFRYATNEQLEWIRTFVDKLSKIQHVEGCTCTYEQISFRPAMEKKQINIDIIEKASDILVKYGLAPLVMIKLRGGSDASYVTQAGIPCIDSMGTSGGKSHSINEYAVINSLSDAAKRVAAIACDI